MSETRASCAAVPLIRRTAPHAIPIWMLGMRMFDDRASCTRSNSVPVDYLFDLARRLALLVDPRREKSSEFGDRAKTPVTNYPEYFAKRCAEVFSSRGQTRRNGRHPRILGTKCSPRDLPERQSSRTTVYLTGSPGMKSILQLLLASTEDPQPAELVSPTSYGTFGTRSDNKSLNPGTTRA